MPALNINELQLQQLIESKTTFLADFWAPWCGDCRRIAGAYDQIADEFAGVMDVVKINVDEFPGIRERYEIRRIPTLRLYREGEAQGQIVEPPAKADIDAFLADMLPAKEQAQQDDHVYDMVIIGGGPGGYTTALYAARAGLDALVLEQLSAGGQMALTHQIENYPGFPEGIGGFELGQLMHRQAERFGAQSRSAHVSRIDLQANPKIIESSEGIFLARTVVLATGATPRKLGLPHEEELLGRGVAYCAACDGMFYKGKTVAVVGGGNSAAADALLLSRIAKKVILIHRRDTLRAERISREPLMQADNVEFRWNSTVSEFLYDELLTGLRLQDVRTGEESTLNCEGVFISIGRQPASALAEGQLTLDKGYVVAGESTETSIPGVYAVGDVRTKPVRQVVTAVADGATAVHMAEAYLASL